MPDMDDKQPHRKKVKHFLVAGHFHELTFSCYKRKPLLTNDPWRQKLTRRIDVACRQEEFQLNAFVFMPEHVHLLVYPGDGHASVSRLLAKIKQPFSKEIKQILIEHHSKLLESLTIRERPGERCFRFWQEGPGFDRNLFTPDAIEASIQYIHMNPVKRGLCQRATNWKWSSALFYLEGEVDADLPELKLPSAEAFVRGGVQVAHPK